MVHDQKSIFLSLRFAWLQKKAQSIPVLRTAHAMRRKWQQIAMTSEWATVKEEKNGEKRMATSKCVWICRFINILPTSFSQLNIVANLNSNKRHHLSRLLLLRFPGVVYLCGSLCPRVLSILCYMLYGLSIFFGHEKKKMKNFGCALYCDCEVIWRCGTIYLFLGRRWKETLMEKTNNG